MAIKPGEINLHPFKHFLKEFYNYDWNSDEKVMTSVIEEPKVEEKAVEKEK